MTDDECFLTYLQPLLTLANVKIESTCRVKGCQLRVHIQYSTVGSAVYLKWVCDAGHMAYHWCSQTVMYSCLHPGDLLFSSAVLLSGNNFTKLALFAKFFKMAFPSAATFNRVQTSYLVPTINEFWNKEQETVNAEFRGKDVVVLGDGRMDSPGHSAQYCTHTTMENDTKKIINVITLDKREADRKSGNMEKLGFQKTMEELSENNYPNVKHSHDIWHAAKNLGKKLTAECQTKDCRPLKQWIHDVMNHFWHVCQNADTYSEFMECGQVSYTMLLVSIHGMFHILMMELLNVHMAPCLMLRLRESLWKRKYNRTGKLSPAHTDVCSEKIFLYYACLQGSQHLGSPRLQCPHQQRNKEKCRWLKKMNTITYANQPSSSSTTVTESTRVQDVVTTNQMAPSLENRPTSLDTTTTTGQMSYTREQLKSLCQGSKASVFKAVQKRGVSREEPDWEST